MRVSACAYVYVCFFKSLVLLKLLVEIFAVPFATYYCFSELRELFLKLF